MTFTQHSTSEAFCFRTGDVFKTAFCSLALHIAASRLHVRQPQQHKRPMQWNLANTTITGRSGACAASAVRDGRCRW